jgi:hypothetical protein
MVAGNQQAIGMICRQIEVGGVGPPTNKRMLAGGIRLFVTFIR